MGFFNIFCHMHTLWGCGIQAFPKSMKKIKHDPYTYYSQQPTAALGTGFCPNCVWGWGRGCDVHICARFTFLFVCVCVPASVLRPKGHI